MFLGVADGDDEVSEKSAPSPSHPPATITNIQHNTKKTLGTRTIMVWMTIMMLWTRKKEGWMLSRCDRD
jgi:hypothetical protein